MIAEQPGEQVSLLPGDGRFIVNAVAFENSLASRYGLVAADSRPRPVLKPAKGLVPVGCEKFNGSERRVFFWDLSAH